MFGIFSLLLYSTVVRLADPIMPDVGISSIGAKTKEWMEQKKELGFNCRLCNAHYIRKTNQIFHVPVESEWKKFPIDK